MVNRHLARCQRILALVLAFAVVGWGAFLHQRLQAEEFRDRAIDASVDKSILLSRLQHAHDRVARLSRRPEDVRGHVLAVSKTMNLFIIDLDGDDFLEVGTKLRVYRAEKRVTIAMTEKVGDRWSAARSIEDTRHLDVLVGDEVCLEMDRPLRCGNSYERR